MSNVPAVIEFENVWFAYNEENWVLHDVRFRIEPGETIAVVGHSLHDLDMARAAGAGLTVGVLTGASPRETLAPHADHVIASIVELDSLLA